ncbi:MAG: hypothetical protein F9K21_04610, partial [Rhodocyclaceae bacterium]
TTIQTPTLLGWGFFCPERQCWRGFRPWPLEHAPPEVAVPSAHSGVFLSLFSALLGIPRTLQHGEDAQDG